jgi:hypothetical protein
LAGLVKNTICIELSVVCKMKERMAVLRCYRAKIDLDWDLYR